MKCRIVRNETTGKLVDVLAPNGKSSILYQSILKTLPNSIELDNYIKKSLNEGYIKNNSREEVALALWSKTNTDSFKKWFGDSQAVDENGEPKLMFHGGPTNIEAFRKPMRGDGIFFTDVKNVATHYAAWNRWNTLESELFSEDPGEEVYPVFLQMKKPKNYKGVSYTEYHKELKENKNIDSVIGIDTIEYGVYPVQDQYVVKNPSQIKSLFNHGEFTIESPAMYYQLSNEEVTEVDPSIEGKIKTFLNQIGVKVENVDKIYNELGLPVNAVAKADLTNLVIELTDGRKASTLPEEAAHMVTAMLGINHPIMKQMMNVISDFEIYKEVKVKYGDEYKNDTQIKFEAVGKMIAANIIGDAKITNGYAPFVKDWWSRVLTVLKRLFTKGDVKIPKQASESFRMLSNAITQGKNQELIDQLKEPDIEGLGRDEFYDLDSGTSQFDLRQSFLQTANRLKDIVKVNGKDRYRLTDLSVLKKRVSDLQSNLFGKNKTKEEIERLQNTKKSIISREVGTQLHNYLENYANYSIGKRDDLLVEVGNPKDETSTMPEKPSNLRNAHINEMHSSMRYLIEHISEQQKEIDPTKKAQFFTENFVIDDANSLGGSQDVMVVYSDGSVSIYDYKFINFAKENIDGTWQVPEYTEINFMKEKSYGLQIAEYKRILENVYGVKKFRDTRILPFNVQYKIVNKEPTNDIYELEGFRPKGKSYLSPLPVARELTSDPNTNKILTDLFDLQDTLTQRLLKNYNNPAVFERAKIELSALKKSIKNVQVLNTFDALIDSINVTLDNESKIVKEANIDNIGELVRISNELDMFLAIHKNLVPHIKSDEKLQEKTKDVITRMINAQNYVNDKITQLLSSYDKDILEPQRRISLIQGTFGYTSEIDNATFEVFNDLLKEANGETHKALAEINEKIKKQTDSITEWAKRNGISKFEAFDRLMNDKGKLIDKFSKDFYNKRNNAIEEGDVKWLKANYKITEEGKIKYKEKYDAHVSILSSRFDKDSNIYKRMLNEWVNKNDLTKDSAWLNKWALWEYADLKKPENHYSKEFKSLAASKPLLDYYNFYTEMNRDFNKLVDERITGNFVANIRKDFVETIAQGEGLFKGIGQFWGDMKTSLMIQQDDAFLSEGDTDNNIPLMYYNNFMVKQDGKWVIDEAAKSKDLSQNLLLFAEAVHIKHNLSKIQNRVEALKLHIANQPIVKTNNMGRIIKKDGIVQLDKNDKTNSETFNKHVLALMYGKRIQNEDTMLAGKYSSNKIIGQVMNLFSANTLALNYVSAFGNWGAGLGNAYIKAVGGKYYTSKQMKKSLKLMYSRGSRDKFNHMSNYFNIENERWSRKMGADLSASKLTKNMTYEKLYTLWLKGDEFVANTIMMSMSQNYGVNPENGKVQRLDVLPKGTKSIYEMFEIKKDKPESGLTDAQFNDFRRKVVYIARKVKGSNTTEEMSLAQMTIWGKSFMFFKNWLPPMASERFGRVKYTKDLGEAEYGRFRSLFKEVLTDAWYKKIPRMLLNLVTLNAIKYKGDSKVLDAQYEEFLEKNPDLKDKISKDEYLDLRMRTLREGLFELRVVTGLFMLMMFAARDWDDDGVQEYKEYKATRELYKLIRRAHLELSFFSNPASVTELVRNPLPILSVGVNMINVTRNGFDEAFDRIFAIEEDEIDKTPLLHYTKKSSPFKHIFEFFEDLEKEDEKNE